MNAIHARISRCFQGIFPNLSDEDITRASTASLVAWDSVAHVQLLALVEEEFGIEFAMEDFEELTSYSLIADHLESTRGAEQIA